MTKPLTTDNQNTLPHGNASQVAGLPEQVAGCCRNGWPDPPEYAKYKRKVIRQMMLDRTAKLLLARPRGGFNDTLVQLEITRRYAQKFGRTLVIDLSRSGLNCSFDDLFVLRDNFGCDAVTLTSEVAAELDHFTSVRPVAIAHRIMGYKSRWRRKLLGFVDETSGQWLGFDLDTAHPEDLLVHEQAGGGLVALNLLRRVALNKSVADAVAVRLLTLPLGYDAVHIRHSDYRTNFARLLHRAKYLFRGRKLLICTDSHEVKAAANKILAGHVRLASLADTPDTGGVPLHLADTLDRTAANLDLLTEFSAMARADRFLFTRLARKRIFDSVVKFSGVTSLVEGLRFDRSILPTLFENADPALFQALFAQPAVADHDIGHNALIRKLAGLWERCWNRRGHRRRNRLHKRFGLKSDRSRT